MEHIKCPICGQDNSEVLFTKGNLDKDLINVICKNCALVYINPRLTKEEYDNFHKKEFLAEKSITSIGQVEPKLKSRDLEIKKTIYTFLKEHIKEGQNILDIGCGFGTLLDIARKEKNANIFGVELGDLDVKGAKEFYGLDLFHGSLEEFAKEEHNKEKFDVIVMHHTFEHLPKPKESLEEIKKLLKPNGILYIGVPNLMNIKKRPEIFFQTAHPFSYSPHSLKLLLNKFGFGVIKYNGSAGYPGGMEFALKLNQKNIDDAGIDEGSDFNIALKYVKDVQLKFKNMRSMRDKFLFFMPKKFRVKLGGVLLRISKGMNDKKFFKFVVLPCSAIAGILFILRHIFVYLEVLRAGKIYNFFSFAAPDPMLYYAPFARAVFDGSYNVIDGRILENFFLPNLWTQLSPILIAPLIHLTKSISYAFALGHFLMAMGAFICFYLLCFYIVKNRVFSLLYSFIFISVGLVFNYLFPISLYNLKLSGRTILPFGSPAGEVLISKYVSFSVLPGLLLFTSAFLFAFLALNRKKKIFTILAGFNLGILIYIAITHFIYLSAGLFGMLLLFLAYKDYSSSKKILHIYAIAGLTSIIYWFNFLAIKMLPHTEEFYRRMGGEITHQFCWSHFPEYMAYIAMVLLILYWGKKYKRRKESIFVSGCVLASIFVLNMQVIVGYNPLPTAWAVHQFFLGFALGWAVIIFWVYTFLSKKINKRRAGIIFLIIFLMTMGKFIYTEYYAANLVAKHHFIPKNIQNSLDWLNENTEKDSVVATPSLATNALIPTFTHNNSMLPLALTSPMALEDINDRYFVNYRFFNVSEEYFEKAINGNLPKDDEFIFNIETGLLNLLTVYYYDDISLDARLRPNAQHLNYAPPDIAKILIEKYKNYPQKEEYLLNKYKIDYIYYGPYEKKIIKSSNFEEFEKIYEKDEVEIYARTNL